MTRWLWKTGRQREVWRGVLGPGGVQAAPGGEGPQEGSEHLASPCALPPPAGIPVPFPAGSQRPVARGSRCLGWWPKSSSFSIFLKMSFVMWSSFCFSSGCRGVSLRQHFGKPETRIWSRFSQTSQFTDKTRQ